MFRSLASTLPAIDLERSSKHLLTSEVTEHVARRQAPLKTYCCASGLFQVALFSLVQIRIDNGTSQDMCDLDSTAAVIVLKS